MKLLIIAGTPGLLAVGSRYNGGGWIASLQHELMSGFHDEIDMSLVHFYNDFPDTELDGCHYYSVPLEHRSFCNYRKKEGRYLNRLINIVLIENPDIILCFGSENPFALIQTMVNVPVVLHLQGILQPITEFILPHAMSWFAYKKNIGRNLIHIVWEKNCEREKRIFSSVKYILGRTEWDREISSLLAPQANYYYCGEMLRPVIYNSQLTWEPKARNTKKIISIISSPFYKGADVILRCARLLKNSLGDSFEWDVYGITEVKEMSRLTGITPENVNVFVKGIITAEQLIKVATDADIFVHPSYIENSPNTVCEAQLLGLPIVATNVGGTSSIIQHNENGLLVPSNDIYLMAASIKSLFDNPETCKRFSKEGRRQALERHNPKIVAGELVKILRDIVNKK